MHLKEKFHTFLLFYFEIMSPFTKKQSFEMTRDKKMVTAKPNIIWYGNSVGSNNSTAVFFLGVIRLGSFSPSWPFTCKVMMLHQIVNTNTKCFSFILKNFDEANVSIRKSVCYSQLIYCKLLLLLLNAIKESNDERYAAVNRQSNLISMATFGCHWIPMCLNQAFIGLCQ